VAEEQQRWRTPSGATGIDVKIAVVKAQPNVRSKPLLTASSQGTETRETAISCVPLETGTAMNAGEGLASRLYAALKAARAKEKGTASSSMQTVAEPATPSNSLEPATSTATPIVKPPHRFSPPASRKRKFREPENSQERKHQSFKGMSSCYNEARGDTAKCDICSQIVAYNKENGMHVGEPLRTHHAEPVYHCRGCIVKRAAEQCFGKKGCHLTIDEWKALASDAWGDLEAPPVGWIYCWSWTQGQVYFTNLTTLDQEGKLLTTFSRARAEAT